MPANPKITKSLRINSLEHLCLRLNTSKEELLKITMNIDRYYRKKQIIRKGKERTCYPPVGRLKEISKSLQDILQRIDMPSCIHGGRKGHSTKDNANPHANKPLVLGMDIQDFFPNVKPTQVYKMFTLRLECSPDVARQLTLLTTYNNQLPQGSPTSTIVAALVTEKLAIRLHNLAVSLGANFTQFVDDLTFSGRPFLRKIISIVEKIVKQEGFSIKPSKTSLLTYEQEQIVTGTRVNCGLDVPQKILKDIKLLVEAIALRVSSGGEVDEQELNSLIGKLQYVSYLNKGTAKTQARKIRQKLPVDLPRFAQKRLSQLSKVAPTP